MLDLAGAQEERALEGAVEGLAPEGALEAQAQLSAFEGLAPEREVSTLVQVLQCLGLMNLQQHHGM